MAWNPSPKVADCRDIAKKWNMEQLIILGIDKDGNMQMATYGKTKELCAEAKQIGDIAFNTIIKG